jgi:two-component system NtrC family response regulator
MGLARLKVAPEAMRLLKAHRWPGNVRELQNVIERAATLRDNEDSITVEDLTELDGASPSSLASPIFEIPEEGLVLDDVERNLIQSALKKTEGNQTRAAQLLGITRHTLIYRLEKYGIDSHKLETVAPV